MTAYPEEAQELKERESQKRGHYKVGESWTLLQMQRRLGHSRVDILKLDVEGYEHYLFESWPDLNNLQESEQYVVPMQILVEVRTSNSQSVLYEYHEILSSFLTCNHLVS